MVEVNESAHDQLAIHTITNSTMSRNRVTEILHIVYFTLIFTDLLSPDAKKPPKGPIVLANNEKMVKWACNLVMLKGPNFNIASISDLQSGK